MKHILIVSAAALFMQVCCAFGELSRADAISVLRDCPDGVQIEWVLAGKKVDLESLSQEQLSEKNLVPKKLRIKKNFPLKAVASIAAALRSIGGIEELTVTQCEVETVNALLSHMQGTPSVRSIYLANIELDDQSTEAFGLFAGVEEIYLIGAKISGEKFPRLAKLKFLEVSYAPVTETGFNNLATLPSLETFTVKQPAFKSLDVAKLKGISTSLRTIIISDAAMSGDLISKILAQLKARYPKITFDIGGNESVSK